MLKRTLRLRGRSHAPWFVRVLFGCAKLLNISNKFVHAPYVADVVSNWACILSCMNQMYVYIYMYIYIYIYIRLTANGLPGGGATSQKQGDRTTFSGTCFRDRFWTVFGCFFGTLWLSFWHLFLVCSAILFFNDFR